MKILLGIIFLLISINYLNARTLFSPLTANIYEARMGMDFLDNGKLRLDIGNSSDLANLYDNIDWAMNLGVDFFTYTLLRKENDFKFPVETEDFYFGFNITYAKYLNHAILQSRLRLAHISSHLIDGYSLNGQFYEMPFVYSREFIDFCVALKTDLIRPYAGFRLLFHTIPDSFIYLIPNLGCDVTYRINSMFCINLGYDFKLEGLKTKDGTDFTGNHRIECGLNTRFMKNKGLFFFLSYYSGLSYHAMFFNHKESNLGFGFRINY